jgi:hypothetical protein
VHQILSLLSLNPKFSLFLFWLPTKSNPSLLSAIKPRNRAYVKPILLTSPKPRFLSQTTPTGRPSIPLYRISLYQVPPMGQIISVMQRCLPLCFPLPESKDQNEDGTVFKHFKKTQLNI